MIKNGRGTGLNIMILLLALSNTFGAWQLLSDPRRFSALFSPFSSGQIRLVAIIPLISLLALLLLWKGDRRGMTLVAGAFIGVLVLDLYFGIWYHLALAGISFGLLYYFYRRSPVFNKKAQVN